MNATEALAASKGLHACGGKAATLTIPPLVRAYEGPRAKRARLVAQGAGSKAAPHSPLLDQRPASPAPETVNAPIANAAKAAVALVAEPASALLSPNGCRTPRRRHIAVDSDKSGDSPKQARQNGRANGQDGAPVKMISVVPLSDLHRAPACPAGLRSEQAVRGQWVRRRLLGQGYFSEVWLAVEAGSGEKRALKMIDTATFAQFCSRRRSHLSVRSEAELLASLDHSNIVRLHEWFETPGQVHLVLEYASGGNLLQCLKSGHLAESQARRFFLQLCGAVKYIHALEVVHRDLKPENILLTCSRREVADLKLADFGIARRTAQPFDCRTCCGTLQYSAPEVIKLLDILSKHRSMSDGYGKPSDMWSLGVILYVMLCGAPPFDEDCGLCAQILIGHYEFDVQEWSQVSVQAKALVRKLIVVSPSSRLTAERALEDTWLQK